jgi:hypothetical protein
MSTWEQSKKQLGLQSSTLEEVESEEGLIAAFSMQDGEEEEGYHTGLVRSATSKVHARHIL